MAKSAFHLWLEQQLGRELDTPSDVKDALLELYEKDPERFAEVVSEVKRLGDQIATQEGYSLRFEDLRPRKEFLPKDLDLKKAIELQKELPKRLADALAQEGNRFGEMVKSGIRGKPAQLMQLLVSPLAFADTSNKPFPFVIKRSFSEGLTPTEYFASAVGARKGIVQTQLATSEPGALSKALIGNVAHYVVTMKDCGTRRGIKYPIDSEHARDRYLAHRHCGKNHCWERNTLTTPEVLDAMKKDGLTEVEVRTPMTCLAKEGVCAYCLGPVGDRKLPEVGFNAGSFSGQIVSEPLTQFALSFKHLGGLAAAVAGAGNTFALVRQMFTMPEGTFRNRATLAEVSGKVEKVQKNPLGGWIVTIAGKDHYVSRDVKPTVKEGDEVEKGDLISTGVAHPKDVLRLKGIEKGRQYLAEALRSIYEQQGIKIHPKHFEAVVKALTNYAKIVDPKNTEFVEGEVVDLPGLEKHLVEKAKKVPKEKAVGMATARSYGFLLPGQVITKKDLKNLPDEVEVLSPDEAPQVEPYITSITKLHLHSPDFLVGLSRAELKRVLQEAVWYGKGSSLNWWHPMPKWILGAMTDEAKEKDYPLGTAEGY